MSNSQVFLPAKMRNNALLSLVSDAVTFHRMAVLVEDDQQRRLARHSILLASLTVECFANCLLWMTDIQSGLRADLDKLPPLSKINACLHLRGKKLDHGRVEVQRMVELIKARNEYVHPKIVTVGAEIGMPHDGGSHWLMDLRVPAEFRHSLSIPKQAMMWNAEHSKRVLQHTTAFYKFLIDDVLKLDPPDLQQTFSAFIEIGEKPFAAISGGLEQVLDEDGDDFDFTVYRRMMGGLAG